MCCVSNTLLSLTVFEGWLVVEDVWYGSCDSASLCTFGIAGSDGHTHNASSSTVQDVQLTATSSWPLALTAAVAPSSRSSAWKARYCMYVCELRKFFTFETESQKCNVLERLCDALHVQSPDGCTTQRLDGGAERFASRWKIPVCRLSDDRKDHDRIAFGEVLQHNEVTSVDKPLTTTKSLSLAGNTSNDSLQVTGRLTVCRRSLPHKFRLTRAPAELGQRRTRASADAALPKTKLAESVDHLDRVADREDADETRSVAPYECDRYRRPSAHALPHAHVGWRHYIEQLKHSFSMGKVNKSTKSTTTTTAANDAACSSLTHASPTHLNFHHVASCNELDRRSATLTPSTTPTLGTITKKSKPRTLGTANGLRQLRELEREFGPLIENDSSSLSVLPTPSDASSPAEPDGMDFSVAVSVSVSVSPPGAADANRALRTELERCSVDSTASSIASTATPTPTPTAESPLASAVNVHCAGPAHPSVLPADYPCAVQLYTDVQSLEMECLDIDDAASCHSQRQRRTVYLAMQTREEQRAWLAAFRLRPQHCRNSEPVHVQATDVPDISAIPAAPCRAGAAARSSHTMRVERSLKLSIMELRNVQRKKNYFCEVFLDSLLHARTSARPFDEELLFCQCFEFAGLPPYTSARVYVLREASGASKRKNRFAMLSSSRTNTLVGRCSIELNKLLATRGHVELENWYSLDASMGACGSFKQETPAGNSASAKKCSPELRIKSRYQVLEILTRDSYAELVQLISTDYVALIGLLEPLVSVRFKDELAGALVAVMHHLRLAQRFLVDVVVHDVRSLTDAEMTFRGNSVATKATEAYLKLVGQQYLHNTLGSFVQELLESGDNCELDEQKATTLEENRKRLEKWCATVCERIGRSYERVPAELQNVLADLRRELVALGKSALVENLISSCIFLRFLCPAILSPSLFGLSAEYPSRTMNRNLTLITKVVQTLVNGTEFGAKESYMRCMNRFLAQNRSLLLEFVRCVSSAPSETQLQLPPRPSPRVSCDQTVDFDKELASVHALLADALDALDERCVRKLEENATQRNLLAHVRGIVSRISETLHASTSTTRTTQPAKHSQFDQRQSSRLGEHTQSVPSFAVLQPTAIAQLAANNGHVTAIAGLMEQRSRCASGSAHSQSRPATLERASRTNVDLLALSLDLDDQTETGQSECTRISVYDNVPVSTSSASASGRSSLKNSKSSETLANEVEANWLRIVREAEAEDWSSSLSVGAANNCGPEDAAKMMLAPNLPQQDPSIVELRLRRSQQDVSQSFAQLTIDQPPCLTVAVEPRCDVQPPINIAQHHTNSSRTSGRIYTAQSMPSVQLVEAEHNFELYVMTTPRYRPCATSSRLDASRIRDSTCQGSSCSPASSRSLQLVGTGVSPSRVVPNTICATTALGSASRRGRLCSADEFDSQSTPTSGYQSLRSQRSDALPETLPSPSASQSTGTLAQHLPASSAVVAFCKPKPPPPPPLPPASAVQLTGTPTSTSTQYHRSVAVIQPQPTAAAPGRFTSSYSHMTVSLANAPAGLSQSQSPPSVRTSPSYVTLVNIATGTGASEAALNRVGTNHQYHQSPVQPVQHTRPRAAPSTPLPSPLARGAATPRLTVYRSQPGSSGQLSPIPSASPSVADALQRPAHADWPNASAPNGTERQKQNQNQNCSSLFAMDSSLGRPTQLDALAKQLEEMRVQIDRLQSTNAVTCQLLSEWSCKTHEVLRLVSQQQVEKRNEIGALTQQLSMFEQSVHQLSQQGDAERDYGAASTHHSPSALMSVRMRPNGQQGPVIDSSHVGMLRDSVDLTLSQIQTFLRSGNDTQDHV